METVRDFILGGSKITADLRRREERGCGPVTGKDRASCQSGGAPALRPGALIKRLTDYYHTAV